LHLLGNLLAAESFLIALTEPRGGDDNGTDALPILRVGRDCDTA
jgi:hypothetical protein